MWYYYFLSWIINFLLIAFIVAIVDESMSSEIEKHQALGGFFIFFIPTLLELVSYRLWGQPFLLNF